MADTDHSVNAQDTAVEKAVEVFEALDVDHDGELDEEEFVSGCMKNKDLANILNCASDAF